ncbi:OsmC family protein [Schaalia sp. 19OD2882]|uniref:OsmC family protein n=1 Tax=Schaalia sp. 19OD2882 TaxID=2794089 RepID=UPI001C1F0411|nr:OsmC family protein [Schaalia sp. 19OD2882]QWW19136.1 OsmC family protein [Schaalia sp. 19OD2882]
MTTTDPTRTPSAPTPSAPAAESGPGPALYLERTGTRQYVARNARGAEVLIGDGPGRFSPGDLLKLALAGCNAMSSDARLAAALGEDFAQLVGVSGNYVKAEDRYESFQVELVQDLSGMGEEDVAATLRRAEAAIDRNCTIGHSFAHVMPYTRAFTSEEV